MRPHCKFENCSDDEILDELSSYSRARFHATKNRYKNNPHVLERICAAYKKIKAGNKEHRRHTKYKKKTRAGRLWLGMLHRCSDRYSSRFPTYVGCRISENFRDIEFFYDWCHKQIGFLTKDDNGLPFELDKDLLGDKESKIYSEDVCVFVPKEVNSFVKLGESLRGDLPIGVFINAWSGRYIAQFGKKYHGTFDTPEEASEQYKRKKEDRARFLAEKWKDMIDTRVYNFLMTYKVDDHI